MQNNVLSVRQLNLYVRSLIEGDLRLCSVMVEGEISNFKNHYSSGHLYFTLKDNDAAIRCVMFKGNAVRLKFKPEDGLKVVLRGKVSIYEKDGQYQFYAEEMSVAGLGDIALQFEQIKQKLASEGMLDPETKRPLPEFPKSIAVVTSDTGAAVQDILNILGRRWPFAKVILCPVAVQGELAVGSMINALDRLYKGDFADVIIIGRGGGSAEDLWAFNSELLARKIYESPVPVISAVGHETDFTICDFVADLRAPTPSAAAELATPDIVEIEGIIFAAASSLKNALNTKYSLCNARLTACLSSVFFKSPEDAFINKKHFELDRLSDRLNFALKEKTDSAEKSFFSAASSLDALSPLKVLARGFAAVDGDKGAVNSINSTEIGEKISVRFSDGRIKCEVLEKECFCDRE